MKKLFIFLSTIFLAVTTMAAWAQENPKLSYQAVVRDNQNKLLTNSTVNVEINILKPNDAVQYTETFNSVSTNQNGLMSLLIGNNPSWDNVDWFKAKINVKITLPGGMGMVESTSDVSAVPLAISALYADSVNLDAVPQSDWDETNPAKCTFIKNKPNIPDTIKNQLADGNSVINHIVDTIADNHIQWATDTLISNRELRDTMNVARGALADTASVLRGIISTLNTNLQDNIDSTSQHIRSALVDTANAIRTDMNAADAALQNNIDTASTQIRAAMTQNVTNLQNNIDSTSQHIRSALVDTANAIRTDMNAADAALQSNIDTASTQIRAAMTQNVTNLQNNIDSTSQHLRSALVDTANAIRTDMNAADAALQHNIDTTSSQIRSDFNTALSAYGIKTCADVMACDGIVTMQGNISANATKIHNDSIAIMKNVSDTATAIRALITGASGDVGKLNQKVDSLNNNLFDTLHIKYVTNTVFADTIKDVRDSISALRDSMTTNYVSNADLCDKIAPCISNLRDSVKNNAIAIHEDSVLFADRIKNLSDSARNNAIRIKNLKDSIETNITNINNLRDSVKMNVQAIIDSSKNIRKEIKDTASTLRGLITDANKDVKALKDSVEHNYVSNTKLNDTLNHYINEVALTDSLITKSGLADTAKNIRDFVTTNYVSNSNLCNKVKTECIPDVISQVAANTLKIASDSIAIMKNVSDTASAIRDLITGASGDVGKLNAKVDSLNKNLFDTLHIKYVTNTVLADTIKAVRDSISALRDSMTTNYVSNADLCDKVMDCADIKTMRDSIQTNAANIKADSSFFAGRVKNLSDSVKMNVQAIIDSSKNIRKEIKDTASTLRGLITDANKDVKALKDSVEHNYVSNTKLNDTLNHYINEVALTDSLITKSGLADTAKNIRDFVTTNYVSNSNLCNKVKTECIPDVISQVAANTLKIASDSIAIMKNVSDTASAIRALITGAHGDVGKLDEKVDSLNNNLFDTLHIKYVTNTVLADTIKDVRDSISALRDSMTTNYVSNADLCDKIAPCISNLRDSVKNNAIAIHEDSVLFADRIKNLSDSARNNAIRIKNLKDSIETNITNINNLRDSVKMNVQAIIDSSAHIRNEISAATADLSSLETRFKADSANLANNYYTKTKINDTLSKYSTTAAMDARHYLTSDSTIIKNMNDTLAKHNTRISANYKGIIDTAKAIRTFVTTNYVSNSDLCNKVAPCVNAQMKDLRDSVNTLYVHTTKAALRDSVAGQIHDSLSTFSSTLHTHANKTLLDTYTQTEADLADAVVKKHEHSNKDILDATTASYTTAEQTKLTGIAEGAEVNVNADWTATSGDAQILNKPTTISGYGITDAKIDMTKKQVIMGTDTLDVSDAAKDGKLTLKVNGDSIGSFSANQATNTEINIKCRQTSVRLKLTEETVDTLSVGMVLAIPTNFNAVDSVDHLIQLYINGVYVGDTVDGVLVYSNGKLTYDATKNDDKILVADERIQVVYWVK